MVPAGGAINEMVLGPPQPVAVPKVRITYAANNFITSSKTSPAR